MRNLEDVLKDLKEAEKEFQEKCNKYGIEEQRKRRSKEDNNEIKEDSEKEAEKSQEQQ